MTEGDDGDQPTGPHPNGVRPPVTDPAVHSEASERSRQPGTGAGDDATPEAVSDDDRNRFGALLDKAAERGLLSTADYEVRLRELALATSTQEMTAIVTDLPAFAASAAAAPTGRRDRRAGTGGAVGGRRLSDRSSPWLMLLVLVAVIVVAVVILVVSIAHLHRAPSGLPRTLQRALLRPLSAPRP